MRFCSGNSTHMQPIEIQHIMPKFHACWQPKDQDLVGHAITKLHLTSSLTLVKTNIQEASLFPPVYAKSEFSPLTLLSFLLRKELGSSLESLLSNPWVHTLKERQDSILFLLHTLSKQLEHICSFNVMDITL